MKSKGIRVKCRLTGSLQTDEKSFAFAVDALNPASCGRAFFSLPMENWGKGGIFILKSSSNQPHVRTGAGSRVRLITMLAILSAASAVLGKLLQIPIGDSIRISFENLPILFAGIAFGPLSGAATGIVADLIGCLIRGYSINPIITLGAATVGLLSGIMARLLTKDGTYSLWRILLAVAAAHMAGSVIIKSVGLYIWYTTPLSVLGLRLPIYLVNTVAESLIICAILRSGAVRTSLRRFRGRE